MSGSTAIDLRFQSLQRHGVSFELTDNTGGTASATGALVDAGATYTQANVNNNFATLAASLNAVIKMLNESTK